MSTTRRTLVLTGGRSGMTGVIDNQWKVVDGRITLVGPTPDVEALTKYLGRSFAAYPEGSIELKHAQERDKHSEESDGKRHPEEIGEDQQEHKVPGEVQPDGSGSSEEETDDGGESDDAAEGPQGSEDSGDGHEDPRVSRIREAVESLDVTDDSLWTSEGLPRVEVVCAILSETVTRAEISAAMPDFNRDEA